MIFYYFLMFVIIGFGGFIIYRVALTAWRKSDVDDKIDEIELEQEIHDKIEDLEMDQVKNNKEDINEFLKS